MATGFSVPILPKVAVHGAHNWPIWDILKWGGFLRRVSDLLSHRSGSCMALRTSHALSSLASPSAVPLSALSLLFPLQDHVPPEGGTILHVAQKGHLTGHGEDEKFRSLFSMRLRHWGQCPGILVQRYSVLESGRLQLGFPSPPGTRLRQADFP